MDRRKLIKEMRKHGYRLERSGKHEVYSNGAHIKVIPHGKHGNNINKMIGQRLLREVREGR